jgi:hypothetical protein
MWERSKTRQYQDYYLWLESRCVQQSYSVIDQDKVFTPCDSCFQAIQVMGQSEDCGSEGSPLVIKEGVQGVYGIIAAMKSIK